VIPLREAWDRLVTASPAELAALDCDLRHELATAEYELALAIATRDVWRTVLSTRERDLARLTA